MTWHATVLTLFPEMFPGPLGLSLAGRALRDDVWRMEARQIREHGLGRHRQVDDTPAGGGAGMVLRPDVLDAAIEAANPGDRPLLVMTPRGTPLTQARVREWADGPGLVILCGRYEGMDQRVIEARNMQEVSLCDAVLSGGELAALTILDACIRLLPGVMGGIDSAVEESFSAGLLEYPQYTRPAEWNGREIPSVLLSGNHAEVARWRREQAEKVTESRRPDLWNAFLANRGQHS
ncbi:tRNA (guanosine(37)-N1)-methyltransferase TrmD [Rhodovarius crocodyli]|uniref:tRNA (guanine-N(1)-)-methyltransferase n=1 Tax=Rhodovarius crocodyli TaxID=1979269 RepID=A0A437M2Q7_9PROT|nr:tRNA (guanosine(37)-N1)-methyltransferase TrmD [Rhodovarius crocodyli]RVT91991.1 tRNA (guanosine(37)-N1)-methyltransferase TrmD [Rhodovarius crocodyli]